MAETTTTKRRPKARAKEAVLGAIGERISMIAGEANTIHVLRLLELLDELRRALSGREEAE